MKKILSALAIIAFCFTAKAQYNVAENRDSLGWGTTNFIWFDATQSGSVGIDASFTGGGAHTTTAIIGITNSVNATNDATVAVFIGETPTIYTWKLTPQTTATNYSLAYTNIVIGVTNSDNTTNGATFSLVLNGNTNTFTWTNSASGAMDLQTNATIGGAATAVYNALLTFYPRHFVNMLSTNTVQILGLVGDTLTYAQVGAWATNYASQIYSVTNVVATNSLQVAYAATAGGAATNLYTKLAADFSNLLVTQLSSNQVQLVTLLNPGLSVTQSINWGTNYMATNAIAGSITFKASNSVDRVKWYRATNQDFTMAYSGTSEVALYTNVANLGPAGYIGWSVENAGTNYAEGQKFRVKASTKNGL